jgi:hypothetical protein
MNTYDAYVFELLEAHKVDKKDKDKKDKGEKEPGFDAKKADVNKDGKIEPWERKRAEAIAKSMAKKGKK